MKPFFFPECDIPLVMRSGHALVESALVKHFFVHCNSTLNNEVTMVLCLEDPNAKRITINIKR